MSLKVTSCQSENADEGCAEIIAWLANATQLPLEFVDDVSWEQRREAVDSGAIALAWMCGLWYVKRRDLLGQAIEPLVAPVMRGGLYENRPNYFSHLMVRADAPFNSLRDLHAQTIAINEPDSHSGCVVLGHALASANLTWNYFGEVVHSGGHLNSLRMLLNGTIESAAIDSTTFDTEVRKRPQLVDQLRSLQTLGPSPIPPWTVSANLDCEIHTQLKHAFTTMHLSPVGRTILERYGYARFESIADADYEPIRSTFCTAENAKVP